MIQFLKDYGQLIQLITVTIIPLSVWFLGIRFQNHSSKRKAKLDLFLKLMANRKKNPPSVEFADALNQIDVVFQDNKKVRLAWKEYFDSLNPKSHHNDIANSYMLDLLSEIANDLNYKDLKQTQLDLFYRPQAFQNQFENQELIFQEQARILLHSKNLAEGFSDEEYKEHLKLLNKEGNG